MGQRSRDATAELRDGRTLTYTLVGTGPYLVCHPGGPGFSGAYFEDLAGFADERTLVLVHPAGTNGSDPWPEDEYSLEARADDVEDLRRALGEERLDLLGHSAGGWVGMLYAARYPQRVRRLLLAGTFTRFSDELRAALQEQKRRHKREPWYAEADAALTRRMTGAYASDEEFLTLYRLGFRFYFARFGEAERAYVDRLDWIDRRTLESFNGRAGELDLRSSLPRIEAETLVVNGEHDAPRAVESELLDGIRGSRAAAVDDAGHFSWAERPAAFRAAVGDFLSP